MNFLKLSTLITLILSFFLLCGFSLVGPDYKELYKKEVQKTEYLQEQLHEYKQRYEYQFNQRETLREKLDKVNEENKQLEKEISALTKENEFLKKGLDPLQKALIEKEKRLNQRQEELERDRAQFLDNRASFNEEIRKVGQLEGELKKLREEKTELSEKFASLKQERQQEENGKNWWKNLAFIESAILSILLIFSIIAFLIWRQGKPNYYQQPQTIDLGENTNNQFSDRAEESKSLPKSEEASQK